MDKELFSTPSDVTAEDGDVIVDGPDGVAISFTPEAADETSSRLLFNAAKARGQQIEKEWEKKREV
jgi:hypothetical protein